MRDWIAGTMAVLGALLVLSGLGIVLLRGMQPDPATAGAAAAEAPPTKATTRFFNAVRRLTAADRLIGWGVVLLLLGAVAAGAISFNLGAEAGTR